MTGEVWAELYWRMIHCHLSFSFPPLPEANKRTVFSTFRQQLLLWENRIYNECSVHTTTIRNAWPRTEQGVFAQRYCCEPKTPLKMCSLWCSILQHSTSHQDEELWKEGTWRSSKTTNANSYTVIDILIVQYPASRSWDMSQLSEKVILQIAVVNKKQL